MEEDDFEKVKIRAEEFYKSVESVYCPYFKERIIFNAQGFEHIKFKSWDKARGKEDQYARFKIITYAPDILQLSNTVQGISERKEFIRQRKRGKWEGILTPVIYYEFMAVLDAKRIKIVIKHIDGKERIFWTIMPSWKLDRFNKRKLFEGNPVED